MQPEPPASATSWVEAPVPSHVRQLETDGLSPPLAALLARRGVASIRQASSFLDPSTDQLHDPRELAGLPEAVERLIRARRCGERVAIVGDYDVDGISATALLSAVFRACDIEVEAILPHRLREGYGVQPVHVEAAVKGRCELIVTADCGSSAHSALEAARERCLDVIVTDHHLGDRELPEWVIEINPSRERCEYPFPDLSGVGVAYKLASALAESLGRPVEESALLRVACLGTICDLVPLLGENRVIAALGLEALPDTRSVGLQALIRRAGLRPPFSAADVGYRLGPRLNAAGRLASPRPALELLLTTDPADAARLATRLDEWNQQRQSAERRVVEESLELFEGMDSLPPILVAWSDAWHRGVVGIAAGRLARQFHRPALLLSVSEGQATGSGRSIRGIHLHRFLSKWSEEFERFGGHAQAVGVTVAQGKLDTLRPQWEKTAAREWDPQALVKRFEYELELPPAAIDQRLLAELQRLEPFGVGNRQPVLRVGPLMLDGAPRRFGRGHLAGRAAGPEGHSVELLGWGWQERESQLTERFEVLARLDADRFHGGPVLRLLDALPWGGTAQKVALPRPTPSST